MRFQVRMNITRTATVDVEAENEQEAVAKCEAGEWDDETEGAISDWEVLSQAIPAD